jgi:transposase
MWRQPKNRKGKWFCTLSYTMPVGIGEDERPPLVAGVDIGVDVLAAIALVGLDGKVEGRPVLVPFPETTLRALRHRQAELRSRRLHFTTHTVQGRGRGHATRAFASAEDKIARGARTAFEQAASSIVAEAKRRGATILAIEDHKHWSVAHAMNALAEGTNAERARYRRAYMRWHQGALRELLEQYGQKHGLDVKVVDPGYSSQTCSACGARWHHGVKVAPGTVRKGKGKVPAKVAEGKDGKPGVVRRKGKQAVGLSGAPSIPEPLAPSMSRQTFGRVARATFVCDCNRRAVHADTNAAINLARWAVTGNPWRTKEEKEP